jgi:hypothetical protein
MSRHLGGCQGGVAGVDGLLGLAQGVLQVSKLGLVVATPLLQGGLGGVQRLAQLHRVPLDGLQSLRQLGRLLLGTHPLLRGTSAVLLDG